VFFFLDKGLVNCATSSASDVAVFMFLLQIQSMQSYNPPREISFPETTNEEKKSKKRRKGKRRKDRAHAVTPARLNRNNSKKKHTPVHLPG